MIRRSLSFLILSALFCYGCSGVPPVVFLYPVVPPGNAFLDPSIAGTWTSEKTGDVWEFFQPEKPEEGEEEEYPWFLTVTDRSGRVSLYAADLDVLGPATVLQVYPAYYNEDDLDLLYYAHVYTLPLHRIYHVQRSGPDLILTEVDSRRLTKHLENSSEPVHHRAIGGRLVLMGPPGPTRDFLAREAEAGDGFWSRKVLRMIRLEPEPGKPSEEGGS